MAESQTKAREADASVFAHVSRTRGIVFHTLLLAGTLFGLVSLGALLLTVTGDAFGVYAAGIEWYLAVVLVVGVPSTLVGGHLYYHNRPAFSTGVRGLLVPIAGLFAGGTILLLFDVIPFYVWFAWVAGVSVPIPFIIAHRHLRSDAGIGERISVVLVTGFLSLFGVPGLIIGIPEFIQFHVNPIPNRYLTFLVTLGLPVAAVIGHRLSKRETQQAGLSAGLLVVIASLSVLLQPILEPSNALLLVLTIAVPTGSYVGTTIRHHPERRIGLGFPAVILGSIVLASVVVTQLGLGGPDPWLDWQFLTSFPMSRPEVSGIYPALVGSLLLMLVVIVTSFPIGVGAAVYLEEYAPDNRFTELIQITIANLAGVPSVVYGLLGLGLFIKLGGLNGQQITIGGFTVRLMGLPTGSLLAGGFALSLLILPIVIISSREAIRAVPDSLRQASYGMGATRWQTVRNVVLPRSIPGILTGTILAVGRAVGETAPLIMVLSPEFVNSLPSNVLDKTSAMPLQVYHWAFEPDPGFRYGALAAGVVTMVVVLVVINSIAIAVRNNYQRED